MQKLFEIPLFSYIVYHLKVIMCKCLYLICVMIGVISSLLFSSIYRDSLIITSNRDTYTLWLKQTQIEGAPLIMIIKNIEHESSFTVLFFSSVSIVQILLVMNMKFIIWSISTVPIEELPPIIFNYTYSTILKKVENNL